MQPRVTRGQKKGQRTQGKPTEGSARGTERKSASHSDPQLEEETKKNKCPWDIKNSQRRSQKKGRKDLFKKVRKERRVTSQCLCGKKRAPTQREKKRKRSKRTGLQTKESSGGKKQQKRREERKGFASLFLRGKGGQCGEKIQLPGGCVVNKKRKTCTPRRVEVRT